jgi:hypothetical protein
VEYTFVLFLTLAKIQIMKNFVLLFLIISSTVFAQDIVIKKATMQTINHGASPTSSTTYSILITKAKKGKWCIDSLISTSSGQTVEFTIVEVPDSNSASPDYKKAVPQDLKKGTYQIKFGKTKQRGGGRPGSPQNQKVDTTNIEGGVVIYYSVKKKHKNIKVDVFEMLETIDAP